MTSPLTGDDRGPGPVQEQGQPIPLAPEGMGFLVRTRWQVTLDDYVHGHTAEHWHPTLDGAISQGLHDACVRACQWVTVHAADGTLESTWRYADADGQYDNQWHDVGPAASVRRAARMADIDDRVRVRLSGSNRTTHP